MFPVFPGILFCLFLLLMIFGNLHVVWGTAYLVIVSHLIFHTVQKMDAVLMLQDM